MARPHTSTPRVSATLAEGTRVHGRVHGEGDLLVLGQLDGDVALRGELTVAQGAEVKANVQAHALHVDGTLDGAVSVSGLVHVAASGSLRGEVQSGALQLDEGAAFHAQLDADFELPTELDPLPSAAPARR